MKYNFLPPTQEELARLTILERQRIFLTSKERYELAKQRFSPARTFYGKNDVYTHCTLFEPDVTK